MDSSDRKVCSDLDVTDLSDQNVLTLRVMPMPADANVHGDVFGGWIMSQVDIAGAVLAGRRANGRIATVAVNSFVFRQPVFVGDLLTFYAKLRQGWKDIRNGKCRSVCRA